MNRMSKSPAGLLSLMASLVLLLASVKAFIKIKLFLKHRKKQSPSKVIR